ncbi:Pyroglutamylated RF-amide peptide receptor [Taenia solium]|eukprot:TsM_000088000 transcript=TsM_000088000 gene=TsM_000088000
MNVSEQDLEYFLSSRFATHRYPVNTATIITLYSTVAVVGFIENAVIFATLLAIGDLRGGSAANVFVGALTVSDMILCVFNVPTQLYYELGEPTEMSAMTCRVLFAGLGVPTHVSCILILLIAIDRYRSVRFPTVFASSAVTSVSSASSCGSSIAIRSLRSIIALFLVFLSVLFSILAAFPVAYYTDVQQVSPQPFADHLNISFSPSTSSSLDAVAPIASDLSDERHFPMYCVEQWPSPLQRLIYSVLVVICQFLTPLIVTLILYARIGWWLAHRRGQLYHMQKTSAGHIHLAARLEVRTRRTHRILVGIVACFAGCWTPWTLYSLYLECTAFAIADVPADEMAMVDPGNQNVAVNANLKTTDLVLKASLQFLQCKTNG